MKETPWWRLPAILVGLLVLGVGAYFGVGAVMGTPQAGSSGGAAVAGSSASHTKTASNPEAVALKSAFYFTGGGVNSPTQVSLVKRSGKQYDVTFNHATDPVGTTITATASQEQAKTIRLFSAGTGKVRQVKVATTLKLAKNLQESDQPDVLYLYQNSQHQVCLATPNYAGNVATKADAKIMAEYLPNSDQLDFLTHWLAGKGFSLSPIKYNGVDVDQAMENDDAPQNTVHDNWATGNFEQNGKISARLAMTTDRTSMTYKLTDSQLLIRINGRTWKRIAYTFKGGQLRFPDWDGSDGQGGTLTWQFKLTPPSYD